MRSVASAAPLLLPEWQQVRRTPEQLPAGVGEALWREYGRDPQRIAVEFPSPKTEGLWVLVNQGWAGLLPLGRDRTLALQPKVPISNVFRMLEYAYQLDVFRGPEDVLGAGTMQEVYESLARVLARRVRDRARKGLHRTYVRREERLGVVRGRLDLNRLPRRGRDPRLHCLFEEHTADHPDNQILLDALDRVLRSGICREDARGEVRGAHRLLRGAVSQRTFEERDTLSRPYDRLNHDYRGLHALARFFIAHSGPTHRIGEAGMTPFLIDMAGLFERFVAQWLEEHRPVGLEVVDQESGHYDPEEEIAYRIDIVLYDSFGRPLALLDTKYKDKRDSVPASADVAQVVSYATRKRCPRAVLVYPHAVPEPKEFMVGNVRVTTAGWPLDGDLDADGRRLLAKLVWAEESRIPA